MPSDEKTAVALGSFDGLHKGHKSVIACALSYKERGFVPTVLLFDAHPLSVLKGEAPPEILQKSLREEILSSSGVNTDYISFLEISKLTPEEFFENIIIKKLNAGAVCCGENYKFGKGAGGDTALLGKLCERNGILFEAVPLVSFENEPVSSTRIRNAVSSGEIEKANAMLDREFSYKLKVEHGSSRGRNLGTPTVNQLFPENFLIPKEGVYASAAVVDGTLFPAVTDIGTRPTFNGEGVRSETFIIGFEGDLYGKDIEIRLRTFLREEIRFESEKELTAQIEKDARTAEENFLRGDTDV